MLCKHVFYECLYIIYKFSAYVHEKMNCLLLLPSRISAFEIHRLVCYRDKKIANDSVYSALLNNELQMKLQI